ncbi:hypothetical protein FACS1894206_06150 [Deltaproteobacteria bacterium]|nr:hypothetical protein FACS1894206_06150 [Deltaproteobacteria bacterium]
MVQTSIRNISLLLAASLLAACSPARTGVIDGRLTTNLKPAIGIKAGAPFAVAANGRLWVNQHGQEITADVLVSVDYAFYTDKAVSPSSCFAYAAIMRLDSAPYWVFVPQGHPLRGMFGVRKKLDPPVREGSVYSLRVAGADDWASNVLLANGHEAPEAWLAKRWVFSVSDGVRAMAEYREPWPKDMTVPEGNTGLVGDREIAYLRDFDNRANVFRFDAERGDFSEVKASVGQSAWKMPETVLDVEKIVGEVIQSRPGGDSSFD